MDLATAIEGLIWLIDPELEAPLPPGATDAELTELEQTIGVRLPEVVRGFYLRHDGIPDCLFSAREIADEWRAIQTHPFSAYRSPIQPDYGIKAVLWSSRWIPIWTTTTGDSVCLDLDPAEGGTVGQILKVYHDDPVRPCQGRSLIEYFSQGHFSFDEWVCNVRASQARSVSA